MDGSPAFLRQLDASELRADAKPHCEDTNEDTWLIQSNETSDHIRDQLTELVPDGDALIVIAATQDAAWAGLGPIESEWLIDHI